MCSSKRENNIKKPIKYHQTIHSHDSQPQSQSTFECSIQMKNSTISIVLSSLDRKFGLTQRSFFLYSAFKRQSKTKVSLE